MPLDENEVLLELHTQLSELAVENRIALFARYGKIVGWEKAISYQLFPNNDFTKGFINY